MESLKDKIALVTGGGSGINFAYIKLLYTSGCKILIADIGLTDEAKAWVASVPSDGRIHFHYTDVTKWAQIEAAFDACKATFGDVPDIVTPGAGIYEPGGPSFWKDVDEDSRYKILDINLIHPIKTTRIAVRRFVEAKKGGAIIYIVSIAAQRTSIITPLYTISKHGVAALVRGMAPLQELADIRVAGVAPGVVDTPLMAPPEARKLLDLTKDFMLPRDEVAKAMMSLLTDKKYKPGTILEVCDIGNWREVELLNDPGPSGPASKTSRKHEGINDIMQYLVPEGTDLSTIKKSTITTG